MTGYGQGPVQVGETFYLLDARIQGGQQLCRQILEIYR